MDVSNMDSLKHPDSSFVVEEFSAGDIPMDVAHTVEISIDMTQDSDDGVHSPMVFHGGDIQSSIVFLGSEGVIDGDEEPTIHVEERCDGIGEEASGFKSDEQLNNFVINEGSESFQTLMAEDGENHVQVGKSMGLQSQTVTSDDIMVQEQCQGTSQEHVRGLEQENPICNNCQVSHVSNIDCRNGQMSIGQQLHKGPSSIPSYRAAIAGDDDGINIQKPTEPDSDSNVCRVAIAMPKDAESRTEETALLQTIPILHPLTFQPQVSHSIIIPLNTGAPPTSKQQYVVQMGGGGADTAEPIPHKTGAPPLSQQQYLVPMDSGSTEPMFNFVLSHNAPSDRTRTTYGNRYVEIQPNVSGIHPNVSGKHPNESGKHPNMKFNTQAVTACLPSQKEVNELQSVSNMSQNVTQNMSQNLTQNMSQNVTKYNKSSKSVNPQKRQPQWCEQSMQDALRAVGHGKSVRSVAKEFSIPHQTLVTRIKRLKIENSFKKYEPGGDHHTAGMMVDVPHKKTRGKQKCLWTGDQMEAAIQLCKEGHSLNYAAKIYGIPVGTLHGRVSGKVKRGGKRGSPSYLTVEEEAQLETLILKTIHKSFEQINESVKEFVLEKVRNRKHPFKKAGPGKKWWMLFLARHPKVSKKILKLWQDDKLYFDDRLVPSQNGDRLEPIQDGAQSSSVKSSEATQKVRQELEENNVTNSQQEPLTLVAEVLSLCQEQVQSGETDYIHVVEDMETMCHDGQFESVSDTVSDPTHMVLVGNEDTLNTVSDTSHLMSAGNVDSVTVSDMNHMVSGNVTISDMVSDTSHVESVGNVDTLNTVSDTSHMISADNPVGAINVHVPSENRNEVVSSDLSCHTEHVAPFIVDGVSYKVHSSRNFTKTVIDNPESLGSLNHSSIQSVCSLASISPSEANQSIISEISSSDLHRQAYQKQNNQVCPGRDHTLTSSEYSMYSISNVTADSTNDMVGSSSVECQIQASTSIESSINNEGVSGNIPLRPCPEIHGESTFVRKKKWQENDLKKVSKNTESCSRNTEGVSTCRTKWREKDMKKALWATRMGQFGVRAAARKYGIPHSTLVTRIEKLKRDRCYNLPLKSCKQSQPASKSCVKSQTICISRAVHNVIPNADVNTAIHPIVPQIHPNVSQIHPNVSQIHPNCLPNTPTCLPNTALIQMKSQCKKVKKSKPQTKEGASLRKRKQNVKRNFSKFNDNKCTQGLKQRRMWSELDMAKACQACKEERYTISEAARIFRIPRPTLYMRLSGKGTPGVPLGRKTFLTAEEEDRLEKEIILYAKKGYTLTQGMIASFVTKSLKGRNHPFKDDGPRKTWWKLFLKRHPRVEQHILGLWQKSVGVKVTSEDETVVDISVSKLASGDENIVESASAMSKLASGDETVVETAISKVASGDETVVGTSV